MREKKKNRRVVEIHRDTGTHSLIHLLMQDLREWYHKTAQDERVGERLRVDAKTKPVVKSTTNDIAADIAAYTVCQRELKSWILKSN